MKKKKQKINVTLIAKCVEYGNGIKRGKIRRTINKRNIIKEGNKSEKISIIRN